MSPSAFLVGEWKAAGIIDTRHGSRGTLVSWPNHSRDDFIVLPLLEEPAFHSGDTGGTGTRAICGGRPHKYVSDQQKEALDAIQGVAYSVHPKMLCAALDALERGLFDDQPKRSFVLERRALEFALENLAENGDNRAAIADAGGIPVLVALIAIEMLPMVMF